MRNNTREEPDGVRTATRSAVHSGIGWVGCLGGIGFTMAIFVAGLAFDHAQLLGAAKLGVLVASGLAGLAAPCTGPFLLRQRTAEEAHES